MSDDWKFKPKQVRRMSDYFSVLQSGGKLDGAQRRDLKKLGAKMNAGPGLGTVAAGVLGVGLVAWGLYELLRSPKQPDAQV